MLEARHDEGSEHCRRLRHLQAECAAHLFAAIVLAHPEVKERLKVGLDRAQRSVGPVD